MFKSRKRTIKITKAGYSFILITIGIGAAGLNTGNNLLYLLFGMMLSFIIISGILSDTSMRKLEVEREVPPEVVANTRFPVKLVLFNKKRFLPAFAISITDVGEHLSDTAKFVVKVSPVGQKETFYFSIFKSRGIKKYSGFKILTKYPFGLIQKTDFIAKEGEVLVYPEIFDIARELEGSRFFHGEFLSGKKGFGINPWGLRSYSHGDDARLIHWKSTAKKGEWMVKEFESEKKMRIVLDMVIANPVSLNLKAYKLTHAETLVEKLISICASMVVFFSSVNYEVALTVNGEPVGTLGRGYVSNYLRALALIDVGQLVFPKTPYRSPINGDSLHVILTNMPSSLLSANLDNVAMLVDGEDVSKFDLRRRRRKNFTREALA